MTYDEALDIVENNIVCTKHFEPKRNISSISGNPNWVCDSCSDEDFIKRNMEYKNKQDRIREAARMVYGTPEKSFWDKLTGWMREEF